MSADRETAPTTPPARSQTSFQAPKGTRDLYPEDARRRRYITERFRNSALRHGFDEIDGPTFEMLDLYKAKSGEGIVSELFSFRRAGGEDDYALRPELTPTVARMYAARAASLPKPCRWFSVGPQFRAERPQRGRLREFLQWNCDILGDDTPNADAEIIAACIDLLQSVGLTPERVKVRVSDRRVVQDRLIAAGLDPARADEGLTLLDKRGKLDANTFEAEADTLGVDIARFDASLTANNASDAFAPVFERLTDLGAAAWCEPDFSIVRGLAYYTGVVFEVIVDGERAVAGGGRYDNLIELLGGPPTPACGFAMGDVVLSLVLDDHGLFPEGADLLDALSSPPTPSRPDAYVLPTADATDTDVRRALAACRDGGLHARLTTKTTRNTGKLIKDAVSNHARAALLVAGNGVTLRSLSTGEEQRFDDAAAAAAALSLQRPQR